MAGQIPHGGASVRAGGPEGRIGGRRRTRKRRRQGEKDGVRRQGRQGRRRKDGGLQGRRNGARRSRRGRAEGAGGRRGCDEGPGHHRQPAEGRQGGRRPRPAVRPHRRAGRPDRRPGQGARLPLVARHAPLHEGLPKDRLRDMASRGDVRAAAALAAYGDDDARRWLSTLPVGDHRAVQLALRAWTPPEARTTPKPPAASKPAPKPAGRAKGGAVASKPASKPEDKAEGKAMASKPAERDAGVRSFRSGWSTARHPARKPRKPPFRERMRGGLRQLRTIWSGVWTKWLAVFRR